MTIQESTICSLVQAFPILLILAQNHNRCLKTPLIYKPPSPTPSTEYYEALDALFNSLFGHGYQEHHGYAGCGNTNYYGKKYVQTPCYYYPSQVGHDYGTGGHGLSHGVSFSYPSYHGYSSVPSYGYKKVSMYNVTGTHGYKGTYAPTQVYNMNHKYKVVVKRNKQKGQKRRPQKLQSFNRENRRYPPQFGFNQNFLSNAQDRIATTYLHLRPQNRRVQNQNQYYYDEYGRPRNPNPYQEYPQQPPQVWATEPTWQNWQGYERNPEQEGTYVNFPGSEQNPNYAPEPQPPNDVNSAEENPLEVPEEPLPPLTPVPTGDSLPPLTPVPSAEPTTLPPIPQPPEPPTYTSTSELPPLTPVPSFENRNNVNFGPSGIFMESCQVEGYQGSCIPILSCDPYVKMLQQSKANPAVAQLLRRAHCGFEGNYPKVCCPIPGIPDQPPPPPSPTTTTTPPPTSLEPEPKADQTDATDFVSSIPEPPVCGTSNASFSRVVGGVDGKLGDFPWMALLGYKKARGNTDWLCGGSLVTSKHVLTASHCIHGHETQLYVVRLGELDLAREDEGATPVDVLIKKQIKHEDYNSNSFTNDIGLLLLARDVQFTSLIRPICLPSSSELRANTFEDYTPLVAGWGSLEFRGPSAQILQVLQLPVVGNDFCKNAYKAYAKQVIDDRVLCAGYKKGGKDACQGDSGGPLMQPIWNSQTLKTYIYQIGVVSFGKKCAEPGFPGVYSRITTFIPWIEQKLLGPAK